MKATVSVVVSFLWQCVQVLVSKYLFNATIDFTEKLDATLSFKEELIATLDFKDSVDAVLNYTVSLNATLDFTEGVTFYMGSDAKGETINMVLGETKIIEVTVYDSTGAAANLAGATAKFAVPNSGMTEKTCTISSNKITATILPSDITTVGSYGYEFRIKDATNQVDSIKRGLIKVENKLTTAF